MTQDDAITVRVDDLARRVYNLEDELRSNRPAVLSNQIREIDKDMQQLTTEVKGLRGAVIKFAFTVAGSAVAFSITVILVWGGHP